MAKKNNNSKISGAKNGLLSRKEQILFVLGILCCVFAVYLTVSFTSFIFSGGGDQSVIETLSQNAGTSGDVVNNGGGEYGARIANFFINDCFGWSSVLIVPLLVVVMLKLMNLREIKWFRWSVIFTFSMLWLSVFFHFIFGDLLINSFISPGGEHGEFVTGLIGRLFGSIGVVIVLLLTLIFFMMYITADTIPMLKKIFRLEFLFSKDRNGNEVDINVDDDGKSDDDDSDEDNNDDEDIDDEDDDEKIDTEEKEEDNTGIGDDIPFEITTATDDDAEEATPEKPEEETPDTVEPADKNNKEAAADENGITVEVVEAPKEIDEGGVMLEPYNPKDDLSFYKLPTTDLLDKYENTAHSIDVAEQNANKDRIVAVLKEFDIEISSIKVTVGPTITLYEITPAPGVRISKIRNLEDDIAIRLAALCIRIIAPIPGKGTVGIEVPNANKQIVPMASLLNSRKYKESDMALPLAIGKTISNEVFIVDMAKMPHLLVAGATGMGKSVGLNAIITSLLYKMHPAYLKFVMVDPKMVELSLYSVLEHHFLAKVEGENEPIITDVNRVVRTLKSLCIEMDNRYRLLQMASVRSVKEYNEKFLAKQLLPTKGHRFMPYIVVIIDEYGDLMMTAGKEVEQPIARIAQKARAVGIHMIIATQRPTTNIITGTIKANFPGRMAFRVISAIDSRTILDRAGAHQLQGKGDMLFLAGNDPVRVQCALVETKEVERVCQYIAKQQSYDSAYILPDPDESGDFDSGGGSSSRGELTPDKLDALFVDAARVVVLHQHGSTSLLQRKFNIGFNRAGRIMDQLCQMGIVGEQDGSKTRQVFCTDEADLEFRLKSIL